MSKTVVCVTNWDGVHLWLDTEDLVLLSADGRRELGRHAGLSLPCKLLAPESALQVLWRPAGGDLEYRHCVDVEVRPAEAVEFTAPAGWANRVAVGSVVIGRVGEHAVTWRVESAAANRITVSAVNPSPYHCLREAQACVVETGDCQLYNRAPVAAPYARTTTGEVKQVRFRSLNGPITMAYMKSLRVVDGRN